MRYTASILLAVLLVAGIAIAGEETVKKATAVIDADGVQRVTMLAGSYYYDPNHITVKVNVPVEISIKRESGITPHDIVLKAPEAGIDFSEDLSTDVKVIRFTPMKTGTYEFTCEKRFLFFKSHKNRGMKGVLEVVE